MKDIELQSNIKELINHVIEYKGYSHDTFNLMEFKTIKKGYIECQIKVVKTMTNTVGVVHGGCLSTLLDGLGAFCFVSTQDQFQFGFTINLNINYIAGAQIGETIICKSEIDKITNTLAFVKCSAERLEDGALLATANIIYKVPPKSKL